jgi:hypothetical protein
MNDLGVISGPALTQCHFHHPDNSFFRPIVFDSSHGEAEQHCSKRSYQFKTISLYENSINILNASSLFNGNAVSNVFVQAS